MSNDIRILICDDHKLIRKGLIALLNEHSEFIVVGEAGDGKEAIELATKTLPDIVLMDVNMPKLSGPQAAREILKISPKTKIIMLTVSDEDKDLFESIKSGAQGYLLKNISEQQLVQTIQMVNQGEVALSKTLMARVLSEFRSQDNDKTYIEPLTDRELEILSKVVEGATNKEISDSLSITEHTVKIHLRNILSKLHLQNRVQAAVYAVRKDLINKD